MSLTEKVWQEIMLGQRLLIYTINGMWRYVNVRGSVHWQQVFCVLHVLEIDQSQMFGGKIDSMGKILFMPK